MVVGGWCLKCDVKTIGWLMQIQVIWGHESDDSRAAIEKMDSEQLTERKDRILR